MNILALAIPSCAYNKQFVIVPIHSHEVSMVKADRLVAEKNKTITTIRIGISGLFSFGFHFDFFTCSRLQASVRTILFDRETTIIP